MEKRASSASAAGISLSLRSMRAVVVEPDQLRHLLGDRRPALHGVARAQVGQRRPRRAAQVDAEVPVEAPVLGRDDRVHQVRRHLVRDRDPELLPAPGEGVAVGVDQRHRPALARVEQRLQVRQLAVVVGRRPAEHQHADDRRPDRHPGDDAQHRHGEAASNPPHEARPGPGPPRFGSCPGHALFFCSFCRRCYAEIRPDASRFRRRQPRRPPRGRLRRAIEHNAQTFRQSCL